MTAAVMLAAGLVLATGGCDHLGTEQNGAWAGCGNVDRVTAVAIRRTVALHEPGDWGALSVTQRRASLARRLFFDLCVIVGHPDHFRGTVMSCPADVGVVYRGVFYGGSRELATFVYWASGCESLQLTAGPSTATTAIVGKAAAAEPASFDTDFAAACGIPPDVVHLPPPL
jgi:hypothetical protein